MNKEYMNLALDLAKKGEGKVSPNPLVGAVIVKDNKIISYGYHKCFGKKHAEINAIENAKTSIKGATMYVTLEPCSHFGKTPPCAKRIIEEGISTVYVATKDPNKKVSGKGIQMLKNAGINVHVGLCKDEAIKLNEVFNKYIVSKEPFIISKYAMSLDGKIATKIGDSKWISSKSSREHSHKLRNKYSAILVGINTIINDNPMLNCRLENSSDPYKVIVDTNLKTPIDSNIVKINPEKTIIFTSNNKDLNNEVLLKNKGVNIITTNSYAEVNLNELYFKLGELGIDSVLVEGGGEIHYSFLKENLVDKLLVYIAPIIIGGKNAKTPVEGDGIEYIKDKFSFNFKNIKTIDSDIFIEAYKG